MKKRRFIVFLLLISLMAASARDFRTFASILDQGSTLDGLRTNFLQDDTSLPTSIPLVENVPGAGRLALSYRSQVVISAPDREYTVENQGYGDGCYLTISYLKYRPTTAGELRRKYGWKAENQSVLNELGDDDASVYEQQYKSNGGICEWFLMPDRTWDDTVRDAARSSALHIKKGESVSFTLPEAAEDDIYSIRIHIHDPKSDNGDGVPLIFGDVLIDTDRVYPCLQTDPEENISFAIASELDKKEVNTVTAVEMNSSAKKMMMILPLKQVLLSAPEQLFAVTNTGKAPNYSLSVEVSTYTAISADKLREQSKDHETVSLANLESLEGDTVVYFLPAAASQSYYLTADGTWAENSGSDVTHCIAAGECVTFTLPETEEGNLYWINISVADASCSYYILADSNAAIKSITDLEDEKNVLAFTDVPADAYYSEAVAWAVREKIVTGMTETTFAPADTCTNAQIITLLWRVQGMPEAKIENPFADISGTPYYYQAALWAYENGLVEGDTFNGSIPCTRAMTVTYLWKLAGKPETAPGGFEDVDHSADYAQAVAWAVGEGITNGTSATTFSPDQTCTRAQIVTFLHRALAK